MNAVLNEIAKQIDRASDIAVYCHTNPDGDALGSMLALYVALKNKGKNVYAYCDTPIPEKYSCMYAVEDIGFPQKRVHELAISVDCSSVDRLGRCMRSFLSAKNQIALDHHKTFERFAPLCFADADASSCAEIIYELLNGMKCIDANVARLIFGGIVTDSACFSFASVTKRTHEIASDLLKYGFDSAQTIYDLFRSVSITKFKLSARVANRAQFFEDNKIALIVISADDMRALNATSEDTEGLVNDLINIDTVEVAYSLSQVGERNYKLSIRTKNVDATDIANVFGGGGHKNAAGCRVNGFVEDIIEKLVKLARDRIE